jgi:drug/metabolite transporter (DMT)-like permease
MHRRPLGRGRTIAVLAAAIILAGCLLPWFGVGGSGGLPATELRPFDGSGMLAFLAALATLALVALPYAAGDRPVGADRTMAYGFLLVVAVLGVVLWPLDLLGEFTMGLSPDRAPGYWIAVVGVAVLGRAVFDIAREPSRR